jgi:hypothetical protein
VRALQSVKVTPKQFEDWIWNADFQELESFLDNEEVSRETKQGASIIETRFGIELHS